MYRRTAFYFVGRFALPGLWGAAALVYFSQHGGLPADLQGLPANEASLRATPAFLGMLLPTGFIGLLLAAALAAEMSTDSGYLLTWATVIYNDLIMPCRKRPLSQAGRLFLTRALVLALGVFLLFYGLWYEMPGNAWDYLAVTGNIYLASVFTLLVAGLYWKRATSKGAYAALVLGAVGPISFLVISLLATKARQLSTHPPAVLSFTQQFLMRFHELFPRAGSISPAAAGASSFALAFLGMIVGSLLSRRPAETKLPALEVAS
jgi:SSS family solute:Na+ symporter